MSFLRRGVHVRALSFVSCAAWTIFAAASASASILCVNIHGSKGCFDKISSAVTAANAGDTIMVGSGIYGEEVVITKTISLVGENRENTIINATGRSNGIYIDGWDAPGLANVTVRGFTVEFANFEGILVQNAAWVTLADNIVRENNQLRSSTGCPGLPPFETNEQNDCGEGIHLMGVTHSSVSGSLVEKNSGGILLTDETAINAYNTVFGNVVRDNLTECGITLASHRPYVRSGTPLGSFGVIANTVTKNESRHNGVTTKNGSGVGLFAPGPGTYTSANVVSNNRLVDNGMAGVAIHNHVFLTFPNHPPNPFVSNNTIVENFMAGNGPDDAVGTTVPTGIAILGITPIYGLVIAGNVIRDESINVAVNSASVLELHMNDLSGKPTGVANLNSGGVVNATSNWWGCSGGPMANGCSHVTGPNVAVVPWLTKLAGEHPDQ